MNDIYIVLNSVDFFIVSLFLVRLSNLFLCLRRYTNLPRDISAELPVLYIYPIFLSLSLGRWSPSSLTIILFPLIGAQAWAPHSPNILLFSSATLPIVRHPLPHSHRGATTHSIPPSRLLLLLVHCLYTSQIETLTHESGDDSTDQHKLQFKSLHESSTFWSWDRLSFHFSLARRLLYRVEGP